MLALDYSLFQCAATVVLVLAEFSLCMKNYSVCRLVNRREGCGVLKCRILGYINKVREGRVCVNTEFLAGVTKGEGRILWEDQI